MRYSISLLSLSIVLSFPASLLPAASGLIGSIAQAQTNEDQKAEADRLDQLGTEQYQQGEFQAALATFQQELVIRQAIGDRAGEGTTLNDLGVIYRTLEQYPQAIDYYTQALVILREVGDRSGEEITLSNLGVIYRTLEQYSQAVDYFSQALDVTKEVGDRAYTLNNLGQAYNALGQYLQAIDCFTQALVIIRDIDERTGEGSTLNGLGAAYDGLGEYPQAIDFYTQALAIHREVGDRTGEGITLNGLGSVYDNLGQYPQALDLYTQALAIVRDIGNRTGEGAILNNLGEVYTNLGRYPQAIDHLTQALAIRRDVGDRAGEGVTLHNLGSVYTNLGQYPQAIDYLTQALAIHEEVGDQAGEGTTLNNMGEVYTYLGQYPQAIDSYNQALIIFREISVRAEEGAALNNLGLVSSTQGQYPQAIDYFNQALEIQREVGDRGGEGATLNNLGLISNASEQYPQAIDYFNQALAITRDVSDRAGEASTLNNLGAVYRNLGRYPQAIEHFTQALAITRDVDDRAVEAVTLNNLGGVYLELEQFLEASEQLWAAVKVWESLRPGLTDSQKISFLESQTATYRYLQQTLIALNQPEQALEVAERGRTRAFIETLAARLGSATAEDLVTANLVTANLPSLQQIRQIAQTQEATLVEYSIVSDTDLYIWVVQPTGEISFHSVDLKSLETPLSDLVALTRTSLGVRSIVDWLDTSDPPEQPSLSQTNAQLQRLHQLLIEPIASLLPSDPENPVIFIPQGELFLVPFPALQRADRTYLIDHHTILTAPSIQILDKTRQQFASVQQANLQNILVVGNPTMPSVSLPYLPLEPGEPPQQLESLPGAQQEAEEIADRFQAQWLTGSQASKAAVVAQMPQARFIHLATHGLLDSQQGLDSAIALAPDGTGQVNDGLLTAAELAEMKLNAELVVLSACNTGRGSISGDGVLGLSRSLILAGVPSVVVSLWSVPDAPTAALMDEFYNQLQKGHSKADALRQAMLTIKAIDPDPVNWAAFTLIGEAR